jgi:putative membrane protein
MLFVSVLLSAETIVFGILGAVLLGTFVVTGQWLGLSASVPVLLGYGFAAFRRLSAYYRFTVSETPAGMQVRRGLFELSAQTIALHRVQGVVISEPLLWRRMGWARLDVSIAGYGQGENEGPAPTTVLPVGERAVVDELARHILRGLDHRDLELRPVPARARWAAPVAYRFMGVGTSEHLVVSREGWFNRRTHVAPQPRIQSLRVSQGPWQRRLGLADVHTDSPPGPTRVRARHRDAVEARRLFDVEVDMTAWARRQP